MKLHACIRNDNVAFHRLAEMNTLSTGELKLGEGESPMETEGEGALDGGVEDEQLDLVISCLDEITRIVVCAESIIVSNNGRLYVSVVEASKGLLPVSLWLSDE